MTESRTLPDLLQAMRGFQESRVLLTAMELDILPACGAGANADAVAAVIGCDPRATGMLLNTLASMGVLVKEGERFRCTEAAAALGRERAGMLHMVNLWDSWSSLTGCVRTGEPCGRPPGHKSVVCGRGATDATPGALWSQRARLSSSVGSSSTLKAGLGTWPYGPGPTCWPTGPRRTVGRQRRPRGHGQGVARPHAVAPGSLPSGDRSPLLCPARRVAGRAPEGVVVHLELKLASSPGAARWN